MEVSELFITKIAFVIEILLAMHLFSFNLPKRKLFWLWLPLTSAICITIGVFFPLFPFSYNWWYSSLMFIFLFLCCFSTLFVCYKTHWKKLFFNAVSSYTAQHLAYQFFFLITKVFDIKSALSFTSYGDAPVQFNEGGMSVIMACIMIICYTIVYATILCFFVNKINQSEEAISNFSIVLFSGLIILVDVVVNSTVIYGSEGTKSNILADIAIYNILCCLMVLIIQYFVLRNQTLKSELRTTNQLLVKSEDQYKQTKENQELINIKIHDWKHQVNQYSNQGGIKPAAAKELIQLFNIYDTNVNTGNNALDLVIREKSLLCQKKGITLQFFGDGRHLSFMDESDIYSLLGNLLDNAIEAESKLSVQSKKIIKVNIRNTIGFISMNVENYFTGTIKLNDEGLPMTTKKNKSYHGYGIRSIQLILSKYEGSMKINITDDIFNMSLLIPDGGHFKE